MCPFIGLAASINFPFRPQITNCPFHQKGNARNAPKSVYLITYLAIAPKAYKRRHIRVGYHFGLLLAEASKKQKGFWKMLRSIGRLREVSLGLHRRKGGNNHIFLQYVRRRVLQIWKKICVSLVPHQSEQNHVQILQSKVWKLPNSSIT